MAILSSSANKSTAEYRANTERMRSLVSELHSRRAEAALGGSERSRERHVARGKLLPRDRVMNLIDYGSPFLPTARQVVFFLATCPESEAFREAKRRKEKNHFSQPLNF